jgi:integrase
MVLRAALRLAGNKTPVRLLRVSRKRVLPILAPDAIQRLLAHASEPYRGILLVSACTGFRLSETLHLTWGDILWEEGRIAVTGKNGWEPKSYEERAVYVPNEVLAYLKHRLSKAHRSRPEDYVFGTRNGTAMGADNALRGVRKVFEQAGLYQRGLPLTHWLRHSVASRLLGEGVDVETVRTILGHADATTTLRYYAHSSEERMRAASRKLRLLGVALPDAPRES